MHAAAKHPGNWVGSKWTAGDGVKYWKNLVDMRHLLGMTPK